MRVLCVHMCWCMHECVGRGSREGVGVLTQHPLGCSGEKQLRQSPNSLDSQHREHRTAEKEEESSGENLGCLASGRDTTSCVTLAKSLLLHTCFSPLQRQRVGLQHGVRERRMCTGCFLAAGGYSIKSQ